MTWSGNGSRKQNLDFRAAERLVKDPEPLREIIAFHCQQAAEKYEGVPRKACSSVRPDVVAMLEGIDVLSSFGVKIRYPGDFPELLPGQEQIVFDLADRTREAIMAQLQQHLAGG